MLNCRTAKTITICCSESPPGGIGKTIVLAATAELLARRGERIAIIAPTHQAVNNALNRIYEVNWAQEIIKIGDELLTEGLNQNIRKELFNEFDKEYSKRKITDNNPIIGLTYHSAIYNLINRSNSFQTKYYYQLIKPVN